MQQFQSGSASPENDIVNGLRHTSADSRSIIPDSITEPGPDPFEGFAKLDAITPCKDGLILLRKFADTSPALYELAERSNFFDMTHPGFKANPLWLAFKTHYISCGNCNED